MIETARIKRGRHPMLAGHPRGVFVPEAVGVVRGYPKTAEVHAERMVQLRLNIRTARERGKLTRRGVPNGWAGQAKVVAALQREAERKAAVIAESLMPTLDALLSSGDDLAESFGRACRYANSDEAADRALVRLALFTCWSIALNVTASTTDRMAAARTILEYTALPMVAKAARQHGGGPEDILAFAAKLSKDDRD